MGHERPGFNTHLDNILLLDFFLFSHSKASDSNVGIIANSILFVKISTVIYSLPVCVSHILAFSSM